MRQLITQHSLVTLFECRCGLHVKIWQEAILSFSRFQNILNSSAKLEQNPRTSNETNKQPPSPTNIALQQWKCLLLDADLFH